MLSVLLAVTSPHLAHNPGQEHTGKQQPFTSSHDTYYKCIILKTVSKGQVLHKVSADLRGITPWHGCTHRTYLVKEVRVRGRWMGEKQIDNHGTTK